MNILIKLMSIVSLVIAPHIAAPDAAPQRGVAMPVPAERTLESLSKPKVQYADIAPAAAKAVFMMLRETR